MKRQSMISKLYVQHVYYISKHTTIEDMVRYLEEIDPEGLAKIQ